MNTPDTDGPGEPLPYRPDGGSLAHGYDREREVATDDLSEFIPTYAEALLNAEKDYQNRSGVDGSLWDIHGQGYGTPLSVREDVTMDTVYQLFESQIDAELNPSRRDTVNRAVEERPWPTLKVLGGSAGLAAGGYVAAAQGDVTTLEAVNDIVDPAVRAFEPFASEAAAGAFGGLLDGAREFAMEFDPQEYASELRDCALDHLYLVDVEYHQPDLGDIEDVVAERGVDALERDGIMSPGQWEMIRKQREDDIDDPVRLLFVVWDPTDERTMVQHVLRERFEDYGDPQAVYNRTLC